MSICAIIQSKIGPAAAPKRNLTQGIPEQASIERTMNTAPRCRSLRSRIWSIKTAAALSWPKAMEFFSRHLIG
jgi:hypothetical protein